MHLILRFFAAITAITTLVTLNRFMQLLGTGALGQAAGPGLLGVVTVSGWLAVILLGPFAAIYLWRLRTAGLFLTAFLGAIAAFHGVVALVVGGFEGTAPLGQILFNSASVAILLSPPARRECQ